MKLYHYRSVDTALKEITNGTFHYSDKSELNDPIEGYVQLYWQGDRPAWEGLFRNYICSLYHSIVFYLLAAKYEEIEEHAVLLDIHNFDDVPLGEVLKEIADTFIENQHIQEIIEYLGTQKISCSIKMLRMLLRIVHETAFSICIKSMKQNGLIPENQEEHYIPFEDVLDSFPKEMAKQISEPEKQAVTEVFAVLLEDMIESRFLSGSQEDRNQLTQQQTWFKVRIGFPSIYVNQMQEIVYPKGYLVCFSSDNTNSAMWGNYADNHRGVCLIYQTTNTDGRETIPVKSQAVITENGVAFSFRNDEIKQVKYESPLIRRNFFESLGGLTYSQINSWLVSGRGEKSRLLEKYKDEEWRNRYWKDYDEKYCLKLPAWKHEKEYRLLLIDFLHKHTPEERLVAYEPDNLIGVIFGIQTSEFDKIQIIHAIKETGRKLENFNFYQAEYEDEEQYITIRKKTLFFN